MSIRELTINGTRYSGDYWVLNSKQQLHTRDFRDLGYLKSLGNCGIIIFQANKLRFDILFYKVLE